MSLIDLKFFYTEEEAMIFSLRPRLWSVLILDRLPLFCLWKTFEDGN